MANEATPYISRNPGDLLSAEDWNQVQVDIKNDIAGQIQKAISQIEDVPHADDADKLGGKSPEDITKDIIRKVLEVVRQQAGGYQQLFRRVEKCKPEVFINHGFKACPLVDVYQLDYFLAVCAKGEMPEESSPAWVNFYLYHSATERRIRIPTTDPGKKPITIDIEPSDFRVPKLKFSDLLTLYKVSYIDTTDLEELEAAFWAALLPNEPGEVFDSDQFCHSPWFEKCCGERRSVKELKDRQDWDKIYLKWMPRKTINLLSSTGKASGDLLKELFTADCDNSPLHPEQITASPSQVQVIHYDFDTIGVRLVGKPVYPDDQVNGFDDINGNAMPALPTDFLSEIKLMLLLKV